MVDDSQTGIDNIGRARSDHLIKFYALLDTLEQNVGGARRLVECDGRMLWPRRGVYFFREAGENRSDTGSGPRIVRVGTHALKPGSSTRLWTRLSQHKGQRGSGGGNHRGSIFRLLVGTALIDRHGYDLPTWDVGNAASREVREGEIVLERDVSRIIGDMQFLWLSLDDDPGPDSQRGSVERNAIALLSNYRKPALDPPARDWLGRRCDRDRVRDSGLWNQNHVDGAYDPAFLDTLEQLIAATGSG